MIINQSKLFALAGLLHDIGKFKYRTTKKNIGKHQKLSVNFINETIRNYECLDSIKDELIDLVENHHNEDTKINSLKQADWLSSNERVKEEENKKAYIPMESIFQKINIDKEPIPENNFFYVPSIIDTNKNEYLFPVKVYNEEQVIQKTNEMWNNFITECKKIPNNVSFNNLYIILYYLIEKYTGRISSASYKSTPDISLFDHLRTTSAYAYCLSSSSNIDKPFILLEGDLSGIQNFIKNIEFERDEVSLRETAKRLRGSSFYIQLLSDTFVSYITKECDLLPCNTLFNGGGHFLMILPNTEEIKNKIKEAETNINEVLFNEHQLEITLIIETIQGTEDDVKNFSELRRQLKNKLELSKKRKGINQLDTFYKMNDLNYQNKQKQKNNKEKQIDLGRKLPKTNYIVRIENSDLKSLHYDMEFAPFGICWELLSDEDEVCEFYEKVKESSNTNIHIIKLNDSNFMNDKIASITESSFGYRFLGNYAPIDENNNIIDFHTLSENYCDKDSDEINKDEFFPLLSVMRMDVDNLGLIFTKGLESIHEDNKGNSISRFATLSREIDLFFSHYINKLAKKYDIYITYSGGDDALLVGSWYNVLKFSEQLKKDFDRFCCDNGNISFSSGIMFCKPSFPINRAVEVSEEYESQAKDIDNEKNAVCLFNTIVKWKHKDKLDFNKLIDYSKNLLELMKKDENNFSRGFIYSVYINIKNAIEPNGEFETKSYFKTIRHIKYNIARRGYNNKKLKKELENNSKEAKTVNNLMDIDIMRNFEFPASYVLLHTRKNKN